MIRSMIHYYISLIITLLLGAKAIAQIPPPPPPPYQETEELDEDIDYDEHYERVLAAYERNLQGKAFFMDSIYTPSLANPSISKNEKLFLKKLVAGGSTDLNKMPIYPIHYGFSKEEQEAKIIFEVTFVYDEDADSLIFEPAQNDKVHNKTIYVYSLDQKQFAARIPQQKTTIEMWNCNYYQSIPLIDVSEMYSINSSQPNNCLLGFPYPLELEYLNEEWSLFHFRLKNIPNIYFDVDYFSCAVLAKFGEDDYYTIWEFELPDDSCK